MSMAYTPGLKRKTDYTLRKTRTLPINGEILVKKGEKIFHDSIVAKTMIPGKVQTVDAAAVLGLEGTYDANTEEFSCELTKYMLKKEGDFVKKDEVIAKRIAVFGLLKRFCQSPINGTIESISNITGKILIREASNPMNLEAYIPGIVIDIVPEKSVIIETSGTYIQGIFGIGGESHGTIMMVSKSSDDILDASKITQECAGKLLVAGSLITGEALQKAIEIGVKGIIVGGIGAEDMKQFLGYAIGVAITGKEQVGLTLIITEGFGKMPMANKTFTLLQDFKGKLACINGATQIRAGVIRPEIIIPTNTYSKEHEKVEEATMEGMKPGLPIRIVTEPYFGAIGRITGLPSPLQDIETESKVRVLEAQLNDGRKVIIPRANVELIDE